MGVVFLRKNKHLTYTRKVVINGEVSSQKLVCPSTPSDRRSCKNILKNINNLNRVLSIIIHYSVRTLKNLALFGDDVSGHVIYLFIYIIFTFINDVGILVKQ